MQFHSTVRNTLRQAFDGGDGGKGGDIVFVVDDNISNLIDFRYKRKYVAEKGQNGGGKTAQAGMLPTLW